MQHERSSQRGCGAIRAAQRSRSPRGARQFQRRATGNTIPHVDDAVRRYAPHRPLRARPLSRRAKADPALRTEWLSTFQEFAIATYQNQFASFNGARIEVNCSEEQTATTVVVDSTVRPRGGDPMRVQWKVLRSQAGWKATDVAVGADGVWLSQLQQRLFMRQLDTQFNGDLRLLVADVRQRTTTLRRTTVARS
ncbi:MAG: ABC transporter substrate-binding protein [Caulobacteraceae bacterium]|nr:ABC transporter substrate-binding protein [Caulobacteraceae bacterium]